MVLIDTSVWIDYIRGRAPEVDQVLVGESALVHSSVLGELALHRHSETERILLVLKALPYAMAAQPSEVLQLIRRERLAGTDIGYVDACLLASALLTGSSLLTHDRRLAKQAARLGVG